MNIADIVPDSFRLLGDFWPTYRAELDRVQLRLGRRFVEEMRWPTRWRLSDETVFEKVRILAPAPSRPVLVVARRRLGDVLPAFKGKSIINHWGGFIEVTPDVLPLISAVDAVPGFFVATGFSGHGFGIGPGAGRLMADLVVGDRPISDPAPFRFARLKGDEMERLETERLILRSWRDEDLAPFAAMNGDPRVMEYFPSCYDRARSDAGAAAIRARFDRDGYGLFAVEVKGGAEFAGFIGFAPVDFEIGFAPAVEIGWRLTFEIWGKGYATEGALACLDLGRDRLGFDDVVSFTAGGNMRSRAVMERIGMTHSHADDFDHPKLAQGHALRRHVLYRMTLAEA